MQASLESWFLQVTSRLGAANDHRSGRDGPRRPPPVGRDGDHRGSSVPTGAMIAARFMELRRRRGLMIALIGVTIGFPTVSWPSVCCSTLRIRSPTGRQAATTSISACRPECSTCSGSSWPPLGLHGRIRRPHRRDVPSPGDHRRSRLALYVARIPPGWPSSCRGRGRVHHRVRRVRLRRPVQARLRRCRTSRRALSLSGLESWAADNRRLDRLRFFIQRARSTRNVPCGPNGRDHYTTARVSDDRAAHRSSDQAARHTDRSAEFARAAPQTSCPVHLPHDQVRIVARARSSHRACRAASACASLLGREPSL